MDYSERVAMLHRLRDMLVQQRAKFQEYLDILDNEERAIRDRDVEALEWYVQLETSVLGEIHAFQKVIRPLESLYRSAYPHEESRIPPLRASVARLRERVLERNEQNRALMRERIDELKREIRELRIPRAGTSPYRAAESRLVDITT
ncbi:MAG: flagellar export chaperone FlgN [Spirochaetaceae bacterium]